MASVQFIKDMRGCWIKLTKEGYLSNLEGDAGYSVSEGSMAILSGYLYTTSAGYVYQLANNPEMGYYLRNDQVANDDFGAVVVSGREWSASQAQTWVDKLISNQKTILENNLVCARFSYKFSAKEKKQLYDLQVRLAKRDEKLRDSNYVADGKQSSPKGYVELAGYLQSFMASGGVGLVISTTAIIVSVAILTLASTAAYYIYKYYYEQSEDDIKYSNKLMETLKSKLTEEEYQQLLNETKGIVTKAKLKTAVSSYGSIVKWGLIALGGLVAYKFVRENYKKIRK